MAKCTIKIGFTSFFLPFFVLTTSCNHGGSSTLNSMNNNTGSGLGSGSLPNPAYTLPLYGVDFGDVSVLGSTPYVSGMFKNAVDLIAKNFNMVRTYDLLNDSTGTGFYKEFMDEARVKNLVVILGISNEQKGSLLDKTTAATKFVNTFVVPYGGMIKAILVGNEIPTNYGTNEALELSNLADALHANSVTQNIVPAMSIGGANLVGWCQLNTTGQAFLADSINILRTKTTAYQIPTMVFLNDYPYFSPASTNFSSEIDIQNNFSTCRSNFISSLAGAFPNNNIIVHVGETGWPSSLGAGSRSGGGNHQVPSISNATIFYKAIADLSSSGPLNYSILLFEAFDEPAKSDPNVEGEQFFGLWTNLAGSPSLKYNPLPSFK